MMQPIFTYGEASSESTRPKRLVHPPPYFSDYEVSYVSQRQATTTPSYQHTAQYAVGPEEDNLSDPGLHPSAVSAQSSRSCSPLSQARWNFTLDGWTLSANGAQELDHHLQDDHPIGASGHRSYPTPQSDPSPYHRPWEPSLTPHSLHSVDSRHYAQSGSVPTVTPYAVRPETGRSQSLQYDQTQYRDLPQGHQRSYTLTPQAHSVYSKDTVMLDTLDKMMGELRLLKEQTLAASVSQPTANHVPYPHSSPITMGHYDQKPLQQSQPSTYTYPRYPTHSLQPHNQRVYYDHQPYVAAQEITYRGLQWSLTLVADWS